MHFQELWDSCAQNKTSEISKMHVQEFRDSCAQNKTSEISKIALLGILGLLCAEQDVGNLKNCTFRNSGTPVRRAKRRKYQKDALSRILGPNIIKLRSENRPKIIKNVALGWLGKPLGEVLEAFWLPGPPRRATGRQTLVRWPTLGSPMVPLWGPFFRCVFAIFGVFLAFGHP